MKTTLPILRKEIDENNAVKKTEGTIDVVIDTSIYAEERWETNFPNNAKHETLFAYVERVVNAGEVNGTAKILSNLKAIYCFIESADIPDFKSFCQMFDFGDVEYTKRLCDKISTVFKYALGSSATTPKNS
jgi:hypothetical protein